MPAQQFPPSPTRTPVDCRPEFELLVSLLSLTLCCVEEIRASSLEEMAKDGAEGG
eukprot:COSAG03_NODE_13864_length_485_cov_1.458549_1_plen_54_part_10